MNLKKLKIGDVTNYTDPRIEWIDTEIIDILKEGQWYEYSLTGKDEFGRIITGSAQGGIELDEYTEVEIENIEDKNECP